jgi:acyl dehydratase
MPNGRAVAEALQIGEVVGEVAITITEAMVDAYAAAVGDFNPLFMERDASGRRIAHPELLPKFAIDSLWIPIFERMPNIRAKQSYAYLEPVLTGLTYRATGYVAEKYERRGRLFVVFEAIFKDASGKEVLRDRRTQLVLTEEVTIRT